MTVVDNNGDVFAGEQKRDDDVRADVTKTPGDDDFLGDGQ